MYNVFWISLGRKDQKKSNSRDLVQTVFTIVSYDINMYIICARGLNIYYYYYYCAPRSNAFSSDRCRKSVYTERSKSGARRTILYAYALGRGEAIRVERRRVKAGPTKCFSSVLQAFAFQIRPSSVWYCDVSW